MANKEQLAILRQGIEKWNAWREENRNVALDLSNVDLSNADLRNADLSEVNLSGVNLKEANLVNADLKRADLSGVNLSEAYFRAIDLRGAKLINANLSGVNLWRNDLNGVDLRGANLRGANFGGVNLSGVNLSNTDFSEANLREANLSGANFSESDLRKTDLREANLKGANLKGADLREANLKGADLREAKIDKKTILNEKWRLVWEVVNQSVTNRDLSGANLREADLREADLRGVNLRYTDLRGANLIEANFRETDLSGVNLSKTILWRANVGQVNVIHESNYSNYAEYIPQESCYIYVEMDDRVIIHRATTLEVIISRDKLMFQLGATSQGGAVKFASDKRLIVQVIAKTNFVIVGDDRVEVDPPVSGQPHQLYFDIRPTDLGEGEVWIVIRQGQMPLLTLSLKPQIVENRVRSPEQRESASKARANGNIIEYPSPSEPLHQLSIIERRNGNQIIYQYALESPTLDVLDLCESKPISSESQKYVENLYKEIESRWISNRDDMDAFAAELRAFGGQLFDELFPDKLQSFLWHHRSQLESIMVLSTEPFIPWELVHLKQSGQTQLPRETRFLGQMGLIRWLYGTYPPQTIKVREGRVASVIPHYPDPRYRLPQAEQEIEFLERVFRAESIPPQSTLVRHLLESASFDLLHFAGHGMAELGNIGNAKLLLQGRIEEDRYVPSYLSATTVEQYAQLKSRGGNRALVVLNACQTGREGYTLTSTGGFARAFLNSKAGAFIGTLWSVGDRSARTFIETLYEGLIEGLKLSEATTRARERARLQGDATWLAYTVYGHPHLKLEMNLQEPPE